ncbi:phage virion morphogenesis protein [Acinetobacter sp. c3-l95]|uniref:phage virion morphogenesis protein n=1 Tax=Acinetobacter sp. c3-l95 TaxID=3342804 RepID=UPI0035BB45B7
MFFVCQHTLENSTRERFSTKQSPDGVTWASLLPSSVERKGNNSNILIDSMDLMRSISYQADADSVRVGTDRHYGKYHQDGTPHMVARPFLGLSESDKSDINDLIQDFLMDNL